MGEEVDIFEKPVKPLSSYIEEYEDFMNNYHLKETSAEEVGEMIMRFGGHYVKYNLMMGRTLKVYSKVAHEIYSQLDGAGKPISAAKAEIMASATPEFHAYTEAKLHVDSINQCINALKSLQKGVLNEYAHS